MLQSAMLPTGREPEVEQPLIAGMLQYVVNQRRIIEFRVGICPEIKWRRTLVTNLERKQHR